MSYWIAKNIIDYYSSPTSNPGHVYLQKQSKELALKEKILFKLLNTRQWIKYIFVKYSDNESTKKIQKLKSINKSLPLIVWDYLLTSKEKKNINLTNLLEKGLKADEINHKKYSKILSFITIDIV